MGCVYRFNSLFVLVYGSGESPAGAESDFREVEKCLGDATTLPRGIYVQRVYKTGLMLSIPHRT